MSFVIGLDFGSDSVRAVVVNTYDGEEVGSSVFYYPRWEAEKFCIPAKNQFRQHPLDYMEGLEFTIKNAIKNAEGVASSEIKGIAIATTGSTPVAVDESGTPLALNPEFSENPNAMFILWKDHTAIQEADEINQLCGKWHSDYTKYVGGIYSSEWFWAKLLHILRIDPEVRKSTYSWVEHCDWIPFLLTGGSHVNQMKRSRCAAGHKALWHEEFQGLPPNDFFVALDPLLDGLTERLFTDTYTSDQPVGNLSKSWAKKLGLTTDVVVAVGAFDAHMGAVGGQIQPHYLSKVMGTSTCDMLVSVIDRESAEKLVPGICGQVNGSIIPGMLGMEAGQSAFGDVYAWFKNMLLRPVTEILDKSELLNESQKIKITEEIVDKMIPHLTSEAEKIGPDTEGVIALDWLNGRRTPDANQALKGAILGLNLGSTAAKIFWAMVEATCYGARRIVERFQDEGIPIEGIIGLGGVAKKSPFVMQTLADVLNCPIKIVRSEHTCALGAAMFAATACGDFPNIAEAMDSLGSGFDLEYVPNSKLVPIYEELYQKYCDAGLLIEKSV